MSTIGTLLAIMIGGYWLFLILKWSWAGFDGVMRFAYSFLPERAAVDDADSYDMSSQEIDEDIAASSQPQKSEVAEIRSQNTPEAPAKVYIIPAARMVALALCFQKGLTPVEMIAIQESNDAAAITRGHEVGLEDSTMIKAAGGNTQERYRAFAGVPRTIKARVWIADLAEEG